MLLSLEALQALEPVLHQGSPELHPRDGKEVLTAC